MFLLIHMLTITLHIPKSNTNLQSYEKWKNLEIMEINYFNSITCKDLIRSETFSWENTRTGLGGSCGVSEMKMLSCDKDLFPMIVLCILGEYGKLIKQHIFKPGLSFQVMKSICNANFSRSVMREGMAEERCPIIVPGCILVFMILHAHIIFEYQVH